MEKDNNLKTTDDLRPEYDFSRFRGGVRGKYAKRFHAGTTLYQLLNDPRFTKIINRSQEEARAGRVTGIENLE
jgi:hypothetical protein